MGFLKAMPSFFRKSSTAWGSRVGVCLPCSTATSFHTYFDMYAGVL
jgi:hypothetical protein